MIPYKRIVVIGGAGFIGSNLALFLKRDYPDCKIVALDNLYRRGSEFSLKRLKSGGVEFLHGDIRCPEDLLPLGQFDLLIDCSAEPSVLAGYSNDPTYLIRTNLLGTIHCLEAAKKVRADLLFLSTSRVYSIPKLKELPLVSKQTRFELDPSAAGAGWSSRGIQKTFSVDSPRSLYGTTKLASELLLQEYAHTYGLNILINRCGVVAGPWQMGKVDQGFVSLWIGRHLFGEKLKIMGTGRQVRDVLHIDDLYRLLKIQLKNIGAHQGTIYNVGGGHSNSVSLEELTHWCTDRFGRKLEIERDGNLHPADIPYYVADNSEVTAATGWAPEKSLTETFTDIGKWFQEFSTLLKPLFSE